MDEYSLESFSQYDATRPAEVINSTSHDSAKKWARKASFMQLGYALDFYKEDHSLTPEQIETIDAFNNHVFGDEFKNKTLTEKKDIELALNTLESLGIDVSKQKKQLKTWD
ncbi:hypothetical protein LRY65_01885 [Candidatus Woesebacteria bacterium]|nr:hypothetical protein [Candidatus Woesebacteria bacterium]MCD8526942.1 hypothetical protein [Candidatus Woesebacteria bacterium]MCD8545841.1 hypothetical protein [Candidatus Woesebacteria bacterium]